MITYSLKTVLLFGSLHCFCQKDDNESFHIIWLVDETGFQVGFGVLSSVQSCSVI